MKKDKIAIVMAAGKSEAMNSKKSKLVHKLYRTFGNWSCNDASCSRA